MAPMRSASVARAYNQRASRYDDAYQRRSDRAEDRVVARLLEPMVQHADTVLDLGCGTGWVLDNLGHFVDDYIGIDVSQGMLDQAREKHPGRGFIHGDMSTEALGVEPVDLLVSTFGSVSYVHPLEIADVAYECIKPGGRFFVMAYAPAYEHRPTYTARNEDIGQHWWTKSTARMVFGHGWVKHLRARGLWSPSCEWMGYRFGEGAAESYGLLEHETRGRAPIGMYWMVVTGQRRGNATS